MRREQSTEQTQSCRGGEADALLQSHRTPSVLINPDDKGSFISQEAWPGGHRRPDWLPATSRSPTPTFHFSGLWRLCNEPVGLEAALRCEFGVLQAVGNRELWKTVRLCLCLGRNLYSSLGCSPRWHILSCQAGSRGKASEKVVPEARLCVEYG